MSNISSPLRHTFICKQTHAQRAGYGQGGMKRELSSSATISGSSAVVEMQGGATHTIYSWRARKKLGKRAFIYKQEAKELYSNLGGYHSKLPQGTVAIDTTSGIKIQQSIEIHVHWISGNAPTIWGYTPFTFSSHFTFHFKGAIFTHIYPQQQSYF